MSASHYPSLRQVAEYNLDNQDCRESFVLAVFARAKRKVAFKYQGKNKQDIEDLEQDVFEKIQKYCVNIYNAYSEKGEGGLICYINQIVETQIVEKSKKQFNYNSFDEVPEQSFCQQTNLNNKLDADIVKSSLSPKLREAVELRYQEDLAAVEAAKKMGITVNTLKSYLAEAKNKIRLISWHKN